jgi:hypothetical protein
MTTLGKFACALALSSTISSLARAGSYEVLYSFSGPDGAAPTALMRRKEAC